MTTFEYATKYAGCGFRMLPVQKGEKRPILNDWVNSCSAESADLVEWFLNHDNNIGIATGLKSKVVVIDIDNKGDIDGRKSIAEMEARLGSYLPETVTSRTQSGGIHLWFRYPQRVKNITGKIGILPCVDIRADGNQVVVAPSIGNKGHYEWIRDPFSHEIAVLPDAWKKFICGEISGAEGSIHLKKRAFTLPEKIESGMRHGTLLSYAMSLVGKGLDPTAIEGAVKTANGSNCDSPLPEREVENIISWAVDKIGKDNLSPSGDMPDWVIVGEKGKKTIDDGILCAVLKEELGYVCINDRFYNEEGVVETSFVKQYVQNLILPYITTGLANKVSAIVDALKSACYVPSPTPKRDTFYTPSECLKVDNGGIFHAEYGFTLNKLTVDYNPEAKCPRWEAFVNDLLEPEDVKTLQEYMGYCLVPNTYAQKALFIIGRGGEGKSVLGYVMSRLFGNNFIQGELHKLDTNRFMLASLENKLVFYDDDLQTAALTDTGTFKKLVTASVPVLVEQKGVAHYSILPFARIICCGNKPIEACYDKSDGFYRRLIILKCKEKPDDRIDDKTLRLYIADNELEGVLRWAVEGLCRLNVQNWSFTISEQARKNLEDAREDANNIITFAHDHDAVDYNPEAMVSSKDFYDAYAEWCIDNGFRPLANSTFSRYWKTEQRDFPVVYSNGILAGGKRVRGYRGVGIKFKPKRIGYMNITSNVKEG